MSGKKRTLWGTRFGFYLAAIGSAFGLGNLWRFPYVTVENGGGAFVLLYVLFALSIGLPLLIGELMLGKLSRTTIVAASRKMAEEARQHKVTAGSEVLIKDASSASLLPPSELTASVFKGIWVSRFDFGVWASRLSVLVCLMILSYYAVISGWVLHFLAQFFVSHLTTGGFDVERSLTVLRENGGLQIALTSVHLLMSLIIVVKGVQEGMEKWVSHIMPIFVVLLVVLVMKSLSLPTAGNAIRFMFYPDFSKLTSDSLLHAIGHVLFSLSVGLGTMVTFGSYLNERTHIPSAGLRVTTMDTLISLFAGLLIFPLLIGASGSNSGPELLFRTLPRLLVDIESGFIFGIAFFVCLYLAALGASIGLLESIVANVLDVSKFSRSRATWGVGITAFLIAIAPALASSALRSVNYGDLGFLEIVDTVLVNWMLPLAAVGVSIMVSSRLKRELVEREFLNDDSSATLKLFSHWHIFLKWVAPAVILFAFALSIWSRLG